MKELHTEVCPACCAEGGAYCEGRVSYYDKGVSWVACQECSGRGYLTVSERQAYAKRQAKRWTIEASR